MCRILSQASNNEEDREINRDTHIHRISHQVTTTRTTANQLE